MKKLMKLLFAFLLFTGYAFGQHNGVNGPAGGEILFSEPFDYSIGELPPGWTINMNDIPWFVSSSDMAGGESPELFLGYSMAAGTIRLTSAPINIEGYQELCFRFKQYLINFEADYGESIAVDVTFDGGQTWEVLWEKMIGLNNIPPDEFAYFFTAPDNASEMQFSLRFQGNSFAINLWAIDDIKIESAPDNDLLIATDAFFDGSTTPVAGDDFSIILVEITNGGKLTQNDYTVRLMQEGGIELASVQGDEVAFGEKRFYNIFWTPGEELVGSPVNIYALVDLQGDENPDNNQSRNLVINVQPENTATAQINPGWWPLIYLPYNFLNLHSLTQTIYLSEEIGLQDVPITGIAYNCLFDQATHDVPIKIYMGETDKTDLSEGWVDPSTFTLVFDGQMDFAKGYNQHFIALDNAYQYGGDNLVVYSSKSYSQMVIGTPFTCAIDTGSMRSRAAERDDAPFDPMNPSSSGFTWDYYPNITLYYTNGSTTVNGGIEISERVSVFPNPAKSQLNIQTSEAMLEIRLINLMGQTVYRQHADGHQHQVNLSNLNQGLYLVEIRTGSGIETRKVRVVN